MKKQMVISAMVFSMMIAITGPVLGAGGGHGGAGHDSGSGGDMIQGGHMMDSTGHGSQMMEHSGQAMNPGGHSGMEIHTATVDGYQFRYELIDMKARMQGMKNMPEMQHSHHLMLHVTDKDGNAVENAKVGYLIEGPGNSEQKAMCVGMGGGYGADVSFDQPGSYTVKSKVVAGDKTLMDSFNYEVK